MNNRTVFICSAMNGMAVTMNSRSKDKKKGRITVHELNKGSNQRFQIVSGEGGSYFLKNVGIGKVIDVKKEKEEVYTEIIGYDFHGKRNQMWILEPHSNHRYYLKSLSSGMVAEIEGGINAEGMRLVQNNKYSNLNQLWELKET